jgi:hypothetical protein
MRVAPANGQRIERTSEEETTMLRRISSNRERGSTIETVGTSELLALHERYFGPLDSRSKVRITETARARGWDRSFADLDRLAA